MTNSELRIGFAKKFYTLWEVTPTYRTINDKPVVSGYYYRYIQNVSTDENKVRELYPNLTIDMGLCGHRSFECTLSPAEIYPAECFRFGKYTGQRIDECQDAWYLCYYGEKLCEGSESLPIVVAALEKFGYHYYRNRFMSAEEYEIAMEEERQHEELKNILRQGETVMFKMECNVNSEGEIVERGITFVFPEVKENYYNGYYYYLPVLKGKAKRVKGKQVYITEYEFNEGELIANVKNFEIVKC